jgi:hypothetical protein
MIPSSRRVIMQNQPESSRQIVLQPLPKPIGVNPAFCVNAQKTLLMKENVFSLSKDSSHIHDENNEEVNYFLHLASHFRLKGI